LWGRLGATEEEEPELPVRFVCFVGFFFFSRFMKEREWHRKTGKH
jgi:hypothetical protein